MPKPNYAFQKRQRELAKKQKKADKENRRPAPSDQPELTALAEPPPAEAPKA